MLLSLIGAAAIAQTQAEDLSAPPVKIRKQPECVCPAEPEEGVIRIQGVVVDAEVILSADRRSVEDRMATIFDVQPSGASDIKGRTKIWHSTNEAQCGLSFDYGVTYKLAVRKLDDGKLETDQCLMRSAGR